MKKMLIYSVGSFLLLHVITVISFFPWLLKNLSLEEGAGVGMDSGQFDAAIRPYLILGFVVATILSVWLLTFLFIKFSKDKKIFTTLFILSIYIFGSILESRLDDYMFTLPSSAYGRIFESSFPYFVIPCVYIVSIMFARNRSKVH